MSRGVLKKIPLRADPFRGWGEKIHRILFGCFLAAYLLVWLRLWAFPSLFESARWPEGFLIVLATATTLSGLGRRLPGQNVILASAIIAIIIGGVVTLGALTGIPF